MASYRPRRGEKQARRDPALRSPHPWLSDSPHTDRGSTGCGEASGQHRGWVEAISGVLPYSGGALRVALRRGVAVEQQSSSQFDDASGCGLNHRRDDEGLTRVRP